jgi:hypothetical protein
MDVSSATLSSFFDHTLWLIDVSDDFGIASFQKLTVVTTVAVCEKPDDVRRRLAELNISSTENRRILRDVAGVCDEIANDGVLTDDVRGLAVVVREHARWMVR